MTEYKDNGPFLSLVARSQAADAAYIRNDANDDVWYYYDGVFSRSAEEAIEDALDRRDFFLEGSMHFSMLDVLTHLNEAAEKYRALQDKQAQQ